MQYFIQGKPIQLSTSKIIGQGGEAEIYALNSKEVVKLFKSPQHPSFANDKSAQKAAQERIIKHQKKLRQFPKSLPSNVLVPKQFVTDNDGQIAGYTMDWLQDAQPLYRYDDRRFREKNGIDHDQITEIFIRLHQTLTTLHQQGIVVGDFNDLNILIKRNIPYFIDTDSWQFQSFSCKVFTPRFVDPILCDTNLNYPDLVLSHNIESDWYAYSLLLFRCLLYVDLYGGIYPDKKISQIARPLYRLNIFNAKVKYPKPALKFEILNKNLIDHFKKLSEKDKRGIFPLDLLRNLAWQTCTSCHQIYSHQYCPTCQSQPIIFATPTFTNKQLIFHTCGTIIATQFTPHNHYYLYWENGEFKRETGAVIFKGDRHPDLQFWLDGDRTYIGKSDTVLCFIGSELQPDLTLQVDRYRQQPCFTCAGGKRYWLTQGKLWGDRRLGRGFIGDVLDSQTYFWVENNIGFGLYQVGHLLTGFIFYPERQGIDDQISLPSFSGEILDISCYINTDIWLLLSVQQAGEIKQHIYVFDTKGNRRSQHIFEPETLPQLQGHCATEQGLYLATDDGLQLLTVENHKLEFHSLTPSDQGFEYGQNLDQISTTLLLWDHHHIYQLSTATLSKN
ncbi:hypothetical protein [[Limnothrix rosea] IAM M-220]|uniref:hypothetical protein n=1 Tax=[Limnothrix rosea] IAM M-220 TaxID=454133 RepID=UPI000967B5E4|nr:hypothetical protein [[Limnothrix rosea] IAM M-220]OKH13430.1 hypothetical protein NIES208_14955 [[Limnothrix rosea] IAM M-220]